MAHDVFICHSVKDKTTADAVCATLESEGIRCWIAPRDVTPGMEWGKCIIDAIRHARIMVKVFTANANASQQIRILALAEGTIAGKWFPGTSEGGNYERT